MIQSLNNNKWLNVILMIGLPVVVLILWAWLAGLIFMMSQEISLTHASPMTIYQYWYYYGENPTIKLWLIGSLLGATILVALPIFLILMPKRAALFGEASFANARQIKKAGLYSEDGIIVGLKKMNLGLSSRYLILGGPQHVLMAAPTRSGKGVSIVIPNLLNWKDSVVVLDIKQENWSITAGFRAHHGQDCFLLNLAPRDHRTHRWNPLFYISDDPNFRINDIQKIGQMLFPKIDSEAPIWQASARSLWLGLVLYLIETDNLPVTMGEAMRQLTMGDERLSDIIETRQGSDKPLSSECYLALKEYLDTPHKTRGSVRKGFIAALELFYNPVIDAATSDNDFDLRDVRKKRMSIYIGVTPDDLDRLAPLINLFFQQLIDLNTRVLPEQDPELKYQCLLLMDEFTAIGKINSLSKGISYIAGYGLRMLPIIQSPAQLRETYGHDAAESFIDNHALQIVFAPKNFKVAKELSDTLGSKTVKNKSRTRQLVGRSSRSENASDHGRALLLPQEIREIGQHSEILLLENCPPILCHKVTWYRDKLFRERGNDRNHIKWPTPELPKLDPSKLTKGEVTFTSSHVERPISQSDIGNFDHFNISDFNLDFSHIEIPKRDLSDSELDEITEECIQQFYRT